MEAKAVNHPSVIVNNAICLGVMTACLLAICKKLEIEPDYEHAPALDQSFIRDSIRKVAELKNETEEQQTAISRSYDLWRRA